MIEVVRQPLQMAVMTEAGPARQTRHLATGGADRMAHRARRHVRGARLTRSADVAPGGIVVRALLGQSSLPGAEGLATGLRDGRDGAEVA